MKITSRKIQGGAIAVTCLALLGLGGPARASNPGDLDVYFGGFGIDGMRRIVGSPMGGGNRGMVVAPDGKIVMAGYTSLGILVMRYNPDGTPDTSFGSYGVAAYLHPSVQTAARCVALQPDGKIVVGGFASTNPHQFMVARLHSDGTMDPSFGNGGWVLSNVSYGADEINAIAIQADGKIVVAGGSDAGYSWDFTVARYNPDGTLDVTYNDDGYYSFGFGDFGVNAFEAVYDMALDDAGRAVVVGGPTHGGVAGIFKMARLTTSGNLDPTFNSTGLKQFDIGPDYTTATAVAIGLDGYIVVAGCQQPDVTNPWDECNAYVARIAPSGFFNNSFDGDGKLQVATDTRIRDVQVQPDGKIVLLGSYARASNDADFKFMRLNLDGSFDTSFNGSGSLLVSPGSYSEGYALSILPDGRFLAFGRSNQDHILMRVWPDGGIDSGGRQAIGFDTPGFGPGTYAVGYAMAIQPDDKVVLAGTVYDPLSSGADFGLARVLPDGRPDNSFGTGGRATFPYDEDDLGTCVALQPDGKIVMAGDTQNGSDRDFMVARFNPDGSVDGSFGFLGFSVLDFFGGDDYGRAVAVAPDGKIVVAGTVFDGARNTFGVARFNDDGSPDTSFDIDGKQNVLFSVGPAHWASSVVVLPDGRILEGGFVGGDFALLRLNVNGSLDTTFGSAFGGSGYRTYDFGGQDYLNALTVDDNGVIYAAGSREIGGHTVFAMLRVLSHGAPPLCFPTPCDIWDNGQFTVDWGSANAAAYAIDLSSSGQVLVGGMAGQQMGWAEVGTTKNPPVLMATANFPGSSDTATGIHFTRYGKLIASGYYNLNGMKAMALARFYGAEEPTGVVDSGGSDGTAVGVRLFAAYPNPAFGRTTIGFELPGAGPARVSIYDLRGRRLRTLSNGPISGGRHDMVWDTTDDRGRRVAAGVYLVRVESRGVQAERKVLVLGK